MEEDKKALEATEKEAAKTEATETKASDAKEKPSKEKEKKSDKKPSVFSKISTKAKEVKNEYKKVIWTTKAELIKQTGTVIGVSIMVGIIIFIIDTVFKLGYDTIYRLIVG